MHEKKKNAIVKDINKLKNGIISYREDLQVQSKNIRTYIPAEGQMFRLYDEYLELYEKIIGDILQQDNFDSRISKKYAGDKLDSLLVKLLEDETDGNATKYFEDLIDDFETISSKECSVFLPVFGINMELESMKIGKIKLVRLTNEKILYIKDLARQRILKTANDQESKELFIEEEYERIDKYLKKNWTCAEFRCFAEIVRAKELAEEETQKIIDIFRFYIPTLYAPNLRVVIGLQGEYSRQDRYVFGICGDHFRSSTSIIGPLDKFKINRKNLKRMKQLHIFELIELIKKEHQTEFEKTLLLGIKWFSRSQTHKEPINKFLDLMTCIEAFLNPGKGKPTTVSLAEGAAILLSDNIIERQKIKDKIGYLYNIRSDLTHGETEFIEDNDVDYLMRLAGSLILVLLERKDEFRDKKILNKMLEYKRLGGENERWSEYRKVFIKDNT